MISGRRAIIPSSPCLGGSPLGMTLLPGETTISTRNQRSAVSNQQSAIRHMKTPSVVASCARFRIMTSRSLCVSTCLQCYFPTISLCAACYPPTVTSCPPPFRRRKLKIVITCLDDDEGPEQYGSRTSFEGIALSSTCVEPASPVTSIRPQGA